MLELHELDKVLLFRKIHERHVDHYNGGIIGRDPSGNDITDPLGNVAIMSAETLVKRIELTFGPSPRLQKALDEWRRSGDYLSDILYYWLRDIRFEVNFGPDEIYLCPTDPEVEDYRIQLEWFTEGNRRYLRSRKLNFSSEDAEEGVIFAFGERARRDRNGDQCPLCVLELPHTEQIHWKVVEFYTG